MILVPVQNTRQRRFKQFFKREFYADGAEADVFCCFADAEHRNSRPGDETFFTQGLNSEAAAVMLGNHAQAGGAAVYSV